MFERIIERLVMVGRMIRRKKVREAVAGAIKANRMEMLEERRLMTVSNVQINGPTSVDEGSSFQVSFSAETDGTITGWEVDMGDGNPPIVYNGDIPPVVWSYPDGDTSRTITATAFDQKLVDGSWVNSSASAGSNVSVRNVAPTFELLGGEAYVGEPTTVNAFNYFDPGADTRSEWKVDWGDGSAVETFDPNQGGFSHTYTTEGTFDVIVKAVDEDGEWAAQPLQVRPGRIYDLQITTAKDLPNFGAGASINTPRVSVTRAGVGTQVPNLEFISNNPGVSATYTRNAGGTYSVTITSAAGMAAGTVVWLKVRVAGDQGAFDTWKITI